MDRREFQREDTYIPFEARVISIKSRDEVNAKVSGDAILVDFDTLHHFREKSVTEWLMMLQNRFESMLSIFENQELQDDFRSLTFKWVNISGGGLRFISAEECKTGDVVEIKMMLPLLPPVPLYIYGEVTRVIPKEPGYDIAIKFIAMNDDIRNEIVKFVAKLINQD